MEQRQIFRRFSQRNRQQGHFALALKATSESMNRYLNFPVNEHSNEYVIHGNLAVKNALTFGNAKMYEVEQNEIKTSNYLPRSTPPLESTISSGSLACEKS